MAAAMSWIVIGAPALGLTIVSTAQLLSGGNLWWLAGYAGAWLIAPEPK
jgi:hypothetical protein